MPAEARRTVWFALAVLAADRRELQAEKAQENVAQVMWVEVLLLSKVEVLAKCDPLSKGQEAVRRALGRVLEGS